MLHISGARLLIFRIAGISNDRAQHFESLIQRKASACGNVEDASIHFFRRSGAGQQVGVHGIVNVSEIATLLAISEDGARSVCQHLGDEFCENARVWRGWVLSRAEDV